jgi:pimeloyl-ACP methyl ester carboxylesterase
MTADEAPATPELRRVHARNVEFAYFEMGSGPLALCLHGFPDTAHSWLPFMTRLAAAGYRCVAPFTRGYAPTEIPVDGCFQTAALAADAVALHDALGGDDHAVIIGHDWGAPSAYGAAISAPDRWRRVVGMAVPPGPALGAAFLGNLDQLKRSWYMFFFQHPLADLVTGANDLAFVDMLWRDWSPGFVAADAVAHVKASLGAPDNLAAALGYYRATLGAGRRDPQLDDLQTRMGAEYPTQPLLYLHGVDDGCIGAEVARSAASMSPDNVDVRLVDGAGHFLQLEQTDTVATHVIAWLEKK